MVNRFDESPTTSDQEELVGGSDLDEDATDMDEMQFTYCKNHSPVASIEPDMDVPGSLTENGVHRLETKLKFALFAVGLILLVTTFLLLMIFPLYQLQLELGGRSHNAYGSLLFYSSVVTLLLCLATVCVSWWNKWNIKLYEFPIPGKRLFIISSFCGISGTLLTVSSYRRVPCHLQDPLKAAALVYSLVFYFFFCRKVMGLQRIFSATTAVVGLFISVDYGLCDEFRCRGSEIPNTNDKQTNGWQSRAVWTLFYVIGIGLWVLHLSLLEADVVTMPGSIKHNFQANGFLTTISRLVARNEPPVIERPATPRPKKYKPKALHLATWIHVLAFLFIVSVGWIDMIPSSKESQTLTQFWKSTQKTFWCHISFEKKMSDFEKHQATLDFLSNLAPYSVIYNQTVQKLRRNKREIADNVTFNHTKANATSSHKTHSLPYSSGYAIRLSNGTTVVANQKLQHRINTNKEWEKLLHQKLPQKLYLKNGNFPSEIKIAHLVMSSPKPGDDECGGGGGRLHMYAWMLILVYLAFCVALFNFLVLSESAVFSVTIITASLPLIGIFWSLFEMTTTTDHVATIIWSPEITGELICSLLGTPIVFLGLSLLCRAHFRDGSSSLILPTRNYYTTLTSPNPTDTNNIMA